jgi:hypothetical protein
VAAALVAAEAARLAAARPRLEPGGLVDALTGAADPGGRDGPALPAAATGAGALRRPRPAPRPPARPALAFRPAQGGATARLRVRTAPVALVATADGPAGRATVSPARLARPGVAQIAVMTAGLAAGAFVTGRLTGTDRAGRPVLSRPFAVPGSDPAPLAVGALRLVRRDGEVTGVRFALGAFDRGEPLGRGTAFQAVERLELELVRPDGTLVRRLTPPGGARQLLPAEYAYTLDRRTRRSLDAGRLRFEVRSRAPRQDGAATVRRSEPFSAR